MSEPTSHRDAARPLVVPLDDGTVLIKHPSLSLAPPVPPTSRLLVEWNERLARIESQQRHTHELLEELVGWIRYREESR